MNMTSKFISTFQLGNGGTIGYQVDFADLGLIPCGLDAAKCCDDLMQAPGFHIWRHIILQNQK